MEAPPHLNALEREELKEARLIATPGYYQGELENALFSLGGAEFYLLFQYGGQPHKLRICLSPDYPRNPPSAFFVGQAPAHPFYAFDTDDEMRRWRHTNLANTDRGLCHDRWDCRNTLRDYAKLFLYSLTEEGERVLDWHMSRGEREPLLLKGAVDELERVHERGHYHYDLTGVVDWSHLATQLSKGAGLTRVIWFCHQSKDALRNGLEHLQRAMQVECEWLVGVKPLIAYLRDGRACGTLEPRRLSVEQRDAARLQRWTGYACLFEDSDFKRLPIPVSIERANLESLGTMVLKLVFETPSGTSIMCTIWPWVCSVGYNNGWQFNSYAKSIERLCNLFDEK